LCESTWSKTDFRESNHEDLLRQLVVIEFYYMALNDHCESSLGLDIWVILQANQGSKIMCLYVINVVRLNSNRVGHWVKVEHSLGWVKASDYNLSFSTELVAVQSTILATH